MQADFSGGGSDWGTMNWQAEGITQAVESIAATSDSAVRNPLISQVVAQVHDELPLIPLAWYQHTVAMAAGLEGVVVDPFERSYGLQSIAWSK